MAGNNTLIIQVRRPSWGRNWQGVSATNIDADLTDENIMDRIYNRYPDMIGIRITRQYSQVTRVSPRQALNEIRQLANEGSK